MITDVLLIRVVRLVVHVGRPTRKLLLLGDLEKERYGKREKKETDRGREEGSGGL